MASLRIAFAMALALAAAPAFGDCAPEPQGEGRIASIIDARTLTLDDGRAIRLAGLAALRGTQADSAKAALEKSTGRLVSLHGENTAPDRYGRVQAWIFLEGADISLQETLVGSGHGIRDIGIADAECRRALELAETKARGAQSAIWTVPNAIKNADRPDDISGEIGQFVLIGGWVRSVREAGGWTYLNFGRRFTAGFAAMVPKSTAAAFQKARPLKGFEGQQVLVRGYVLRGRGPRIEMTSPEQIELAGKDAVAIAGTRD